MLPPLIILDRDGVINEDSESFIKSPDEFTPIPGSLEAIAKLKKSGAIVAIATNQSGLARGLFTTTILQQMHQKLATLLAKQNAKIDYVAICPHGPNDHCNCRKPKPGLLTEICQKFNITPQSAIFIGDSFRDYEAAKTINMPFALVLSGKGSKTLAEHPLLQQEVSIYQDLEAFTKQIL